MRLGVIDIGSNTVHLLIASIYPGGRPVADSSDRTAIRLMRYLTPDGAISDEGVALLIDAAARARAQVENTTVDEVLATATSAVREASNGEEVIARLEDTLGMPLQVLGGETEARLTFLAARRWVGWSAERLLLLDIGGGSLELAHGAEEMPEIATSVPLGAGRMTRTFMPDDPPTSEQIKALREYAREQLATVTPTLLAQPRADHVIGTSKTIRSLGQLAGRVIMGQTSSVHRTRMSRKSLSEWIPRLAKIPADVRHVLPGVTPERTYQIVAGAVVLEEAMKALHVVELDICPWALREGVLLGYAESMSRIAPSLG